MTRAAIGAWAVLGIFLGLLPAAGCARPRAEAPRDLHTMPTRSIDGTEEWSGTVLVDRIVVVRRSGHLRVAPGTRILFRRIDWDGDGIGDAEITVEGSIEMRGTAAAPIVLASAEPQPAPGDWKYLLVNFARDAVIEYTRISHAFSGLQVHYSPAEVRRSEFAHNVDGVRFSTARLQVTQSWLHHNTNGVRYEERGHPAVLVENEISDNHVGIFAVTECRDRSTIQRNNLLRNRYAIKLGFDQLQDLHYPDNYWGTTALGAVREAVLDGRVDPDLGRVELQPLAIRRFPVPVPPFPEPTL